MIFLRQRSRFLSVFRLFCLLSMWGMALPAHAQQTIAAASAVTLSAETSANGVLIQWGDSSSVVAASTDAAAAASTLPRLRYQGYELPMQLVSIELDNADSLSSLQFEQVTAEIVAADAIQPAAPLMPAVIDEQGEFDLSQNVEEVALPDSPAFVLRAGVVNGKNVAILAISPYYSENGSTKLASQIRFVAPGARMLDAADAATSLLADLPQAAVIPNVRPSNPAAEKLAARIIVSAPGMQKIPFSAISAAGLGTSGLGVTYNGTAIATQIVNNELRFYAGPLLGDRWNDNQVYWLTADGSTPLSMGTRSVAPASAASRNQAVEKGYWRKTPEYISRYAGPDGDHWFAATLDVKAQSTFTASFASILPAVGGTNYTLRLTPLTRTDEERRCILRVRSGAEAKEVDIRAMITSTSGLSQLATAWSGVVTSTTSATTISVDLLSRVVPKDAQNPPSAPACAAYFDTIDWARTVSLNFNGNGAAFSGVSGTWNYQWSNLPAGHALYDVTNPNQPVILTDYTPAGFLDGATAHDYVMVGDSSWKTPQVVKDVAFNFASVGGANAVYIIAPSFERLKNSRSLIQPLVDHRKSQGYSVAVIDVQDIYDAWNFGQVSPEAIRNFLQYAATNWNPTPKSVVLVGDSTVDARNWGAVPVEKGNNINFIPPFMGQNIDPWLGEAACDQCYVQLNGADAVTGDSLVSNTSFFDTDLWIGRFPVKSEQDLSTVVNKIIAYETATDLDATWRRTSVFLADNYVRSAINNQPQFDAAGNFAKDSDTQISRLLSASKAQRIYYDPYPKYSGATANETWRITDPTAVMPKVISTVSQGAGLVVYGGHSNHWNMGNLEQDVTQIVEGKAVSVSVTAGNVLTLYDVDNYSNKDKYFIQLSMTCLTSQFVKPAASGTTIDERVFLNPNGGSIGVWGPAGLSVAHGHDKLQEGFFDELNKNVSMTMPFGQLIEAGMQELLLHGVCCQDALQTFVVLGDPLTRARVFIPTEIYLPIVTK